MMEERQESKVFWLVMLALFMLTRLPVMENYLSIDNVNLAFSLEKFDPRIHQPQPPGYPFFVAFGKIVNLVFRDPERTFVAISILVSALCLPVTFLLARRMFSAWTGAAAAFLLLVNPVFWFTGLVPDMATLRDRATSRTAKVIFGTLALGWRGSARHWQHYETAYLILAGLATPLVLSVHSIVSMDFAVAQLPGWHTTIFPPYFVAGAIFSGFAMVVTLMVITRKAFGLEHVITMRHFDYMAKIMLLTGMMVGYAYSLEFFIAWYSGSAYELFTFKNRAFGPYAWAYWTMVSCNVLSPQLFWFKKVRSSLTWLFVLSIFVNIGMWFERFVIIVTSLHRDFLPSSWFMFTPTIWDVATMLGSFGLFFTLFCLFVRFLPIVATAEVKSVLPQAEAHPRLAPRIAHDEPAPASGRLARAHAEGDAS
jgi:hypothetical protein